MFGFQNTEFPCPLFFSGSSWKMRSDPKERTNHERGENGIRGTGGSAQDSEDHGGGKSHRHSWEVGRLEAACPGGGEEGGAPGECHPTRQIQRWVWLQRGLSLIREAFWNKWMIIPRANPKARQIVSGGKVKLYKEMSSWDIEDSALNNIYRHVKMQTRNEGFEILRIVTLTRRKETCVWVCIAGGKYLHHKPSTVGSHYTTLH